MSTLITSRFSVAFCPLCARDVLLHYLSHQGDLVTACVHCDAAIDATSQPPDKAGVRSLTSDAVSAMGYVFDDAKPAQQPASGCGKCCNSRKHTPAGPRPVHLSPCT